MSRNPNPLDPCTRSFMQCNNPCQHEPGTCPELLPTQIDTFTTQFFGSVGKSNVGGSVAWSLPCGLDVGIAANPRQADESLACYFLRLFEAGLTGTRGLPGRDGAAGEPGEDAFSFTRQEFLQPSPLSPYITIALHPSASLVQGLFYEIENSGFYQLQNISTDGTALLVLVQAIPAALPVIPTGSLVVAYGMPGIRVQGPKGQTGDTGPIGVTGAKGIPGLPGGQGNQGATVSLASGHQFANPSYVDQVFNSYTDWRYPQGPVFQPPVLTENATYFMLFACQTWIFNSFSAAVVNGSIWTRIMKFTGAGGGAVDGTERCLTLQGHTLGNTGHPRASQVSYHPVIGTVAAGETNFWIPASKSDLSGNFGGYIVSPYSVVNWFRML